ncbi:MAG: PIN domain-containing protein [bacterium]
MSKYNRAGFLLAGFLLGLLIAPYIEKWLEALHKQALRSIMRFSPHSLASGFVGLLMGFFFSVLVTFPIWLFLPKARSLSLVLMALGCLFFGYMGVLIFSRVSLWGGNVVGSIAYRADAALPKVLDTSVLIDGRILELIKSRFVEGKLFVPDMVLNELQGIADDSDATRRKRGRRGLEVVTKIKELEGVLMEVVDLPSPRAGEATAVDARLVNYAKSIGGSLITNDYNLTKIAGLRGVNVMNLNVLARALRKSLMPGEKVEVNIVKTGKEHGQGIAYLDDGTMLVIENGEKFVGGIAPVEINSVMQTVAGRLIFARITDSPVSDDIQEDGEAERFD